MLLIVRIVIVKVFSLYIYFAYFLFVSFGALSYSPKWEAKNSIDWVEVFGKDTSDSHNAVRVNIKQLQKTLLMHDNGILIQLPLPTGKLVDFYLTYSSIIAPELAKKFPLLKTFSGSEIGNASNSGRFDITPNGFHGMFRYNGRMVFIEPTNKNSAENYKSYYREHSHEEVALNNAIKLNEPKRIVNPYIGIEKANRESRLNSINNAATSQIRTYRLAVSAVGEYTQYHGGTVESALSEIVTMVNRLNEVFQRDLSIKLELVADNDKLVFTDRNTDPFNNNDDDGGLNTAVIDNAIGADNYDIGHVVGTGGGGLAVLGAVCFEGYKGDGVTGSPNPVNDAFYIDYVAHEIGHQFGAEHTFNGTAGACDSGRDRTAAYEPGSGSTIMAYAGICGNQNLQNNSDPYFAAKSLIQIDAFVSSSFRTSCGVMQDAVNNTPQVDGGDDSVIPANTPFELIGSATDADDDAMTFSWQQYDLGTESSSAAEQVDDGSRPLFRVFDPSESGIRVFPKMSDVLAGNASFGETFPTTDRDLNFKLIVRDNLGGVGFDDVFVQVVDKGEAFAITSPSSLANWTEQSPIVTWNVVGTDEAPISCTNVDIHLSVDGGSSFDTKIAENVLNNGEAIVDLGSIQTSSARIKVKCSNNIFFAVNSGDFSIDIVAPIRILDQQIIELSENSSLLITPNMFTFDQVAESIVVLAGTNYSVEGNVVTPNREFSGELSINVAGIIGGEQGEVFAATVNVIAIEVPVITSQSNLEIDENTSLTLTTDLFGYAGISAEQLEIQVGDNYDISGTTITPAADFNGTLTVGVIAITNGKRSDTFAASVTVNDVTTPAPTPTPTPTPDTNESSSSGGSFSLFFLCALALVFIFRKGVCMKRFQSLFTVVLSMTLISCVDQTEAENHQKTIKPVAKSIEVSDEVLVLAQVEAALQKSLKAQDYRILATSGRRTTYPGIDISEYDFVKDKCDDRFMPETSDVIENKQDREERRKRENYMKLYNQRMLVHCKANNAA